MIKEAYVSFEIAKLLKEKGFDWDCYAIYGKSKEDFHTNTDKAFNNGGLRVISAPTHQMACAWLREKGYHISILYQRKYKSWGRIIQELSTGIEWSIGGFDSHDRAVENAIIYTLENLI